MEWVLKHFKATLKEERDVVNRFIDQHNIIQYFLW